MTPQERALTLAGQPLANRAAIVAAGPLANFVLAVAIFAALFVVFGRAEQTPRIGAVEPGSPAALAGFQVGDLVKAVNGRPIATFEDLQQATLLSTGLPMSFVVERAGDETRLTATPEIAVVDQGPLGKRRMGRLGLASTRDPADVRIERCALPACVVWGAQEVGFIVEATGAYVGGLFAGREIGRQYVRADRRRPDRRRDGESQPVAIAEPGGTVLGLGRPDESVAGAAAGRRPPALFRLRGAARPTVERADAADRLPNRRRLRRALVIFTTSHDILRLVGAN